MASPESVGQRFEVLSDPARRPRRSPLSMLTEMFMRVLRTGADGVERIAFIGYVNESQHDVGTKISTVNLRAPESLILESFEPLFPIPLAEHVTAPQVFEFWWKQLGYVFGLPDPRSFSAVARRSRQRRTGTCRAVCAGCIPACWQRPVE